MLSLPHLIVLFVVALVIFGPQKLPELARMLGKATAEFRKMTSDFRYALEDEVRDLERQGRIRDEEVAAALKAVESPAAPPEGTLPRELPLEGASIQAGNDPQHNDDPYTIHQPETKAVRSLHETPSDDNSAV